MYLSYRIPFQLAVLKQDLLLVTHHSRLLAPLASRLLAPCRRGLLSDPATVLQLAFLLLQRWIASL